MKKKFEIGIEGSGAIIKKCSQQYGSGGIDICFKDYKSFAKFAEKQKGAVQSEFCNIICSLPLEAACFIYHHPGASFDIAEWQKIANSKKYEYKSSLWLPEGWELGIDGSQATITENNSKGIDISFKNYESFARFFGKQPGVIQSEYCSLICSLTLEAASSIYGYPGADFDMQAWQESAQIQQEKELLLIEPLAKLPAF